MVTIFLPACIELLNPCFPLDKRYAAVSGKHTKIDPEWPIAEVFIFYMSRITMTNAKIGETRVVSAPITADCDVRG